MHRKLIGITLLLLITQIVNISCYSTMVKPETRQESNEYWKQQFHKGQLVKILKTDSSRVQFKVTEITDNSISGVFAGKEYTVLYDEILKVARFRDKAIKHVVSTVLLTMVGLIILMYIEMGDENFTLSG